MSPVYLCPNTMAWPGTLCSDQTLPSQLPLHRPSALTSSSQRLCSWGPAGPAGPWQTGYRSSHWTQPGPPASPPAPLHRSRKEPRPRPSHLPARGCSSSTWARTSDNSTCFTINFYSLLSRKNNWQTETVWLKKKWKLKDISLNFIKICILGQENIIWEKIVKPFLYFWTTRFKYPFGSDEIFEQDFTTSPKIKKQKNVADFIRV